MPACGWPAASAPGWPAPAKCRYGTGIEPPKGDGTRARPSWPPVTALTVIPPAKAGTMPPRMASGTAYGKARGTTRPATAPRPEAGAGNGPATGSCSGIRSGVSLGVATCDPQVGLAPGSVGRDRPAACGIGAAGPSPHPCSMIGVNGSRACRRIASDRRICSASSPEGTKPPSDTRAGFAGAGLSAASASKRGCEGAEDVTCSFAPLFSDAGWTTGCRTAAASSGAPHVGASSSRKGASGLDG